jgi:adenosylcobinamide-phosphate synthase
MQAVGFRLAASLKRTQSDFRVISFAHLWMLAAALALDAIVGDPARIWEKIPHPVAVIGRFVSLLDRILNRRGASPRTSRVAGAFAVFLLVGISAAIGFLLEYAFVSIPFGWIGTVFVAAILFAGRGLYDHVAAVAKAFDAGGLEAARGAVSRIVGRDPVSLDEAGVSRAAIESAAENFSDGVVAPALWFALLGLPGLFAYKAINTADSMIGHVTPRHRDFGWSAARLDDLVNLPASRLAGAILVLASPFAGGRIGRAWQVMIADARKHRSPNAGWPEAAMAAALGIALAGPRRYRGMIADDPYLNADGRKRATPDDIRRALKVYLGAWGILLFLAAAGGAAILALQA